MSGTFGELFDKKNRIIEVPSYQRAYSWEKEQIRQFIDDLTEVQGDYYLGHFLFERNGETNLFVIDGQQRITTCIIFFSVLHTELIMRKGKGEKISISLDDIEDYYLRDIRKGTQKFRTVPDDNNYFQEIIIERRREATAVCDSLSKRRIGTAKELFEGFAGTCTTPMLEKAYTLIEKAAVTENIVTGKVRSSQIFAFQNDRGKKLTDLEVLKAFLMLQVYVLSTSSEKAEEDIKYIESNFATVYRQLGKIKSLKEDEVLVYLWRAIGPKGLYSEDTVAEIKKEIQNSENRIKWIKDFSGGIARAFQFVEMVESSSDQWVCNLHALNNMALSWPFLLRANHFGIQPADLSRLANLLENITFRSLIRGGRADIQSRLNNVLGILQGPETIETLIETVKKNILNDGWWSYWADSEMLIWLNGPMYQNRVDNYLLWRYELHIANPHHPLPHRVTFQDLITNESIEHIAPQTPTNGEPLANGYGKYEDSDNLDGGIVSGGWLNCIGNLMLISRSHNSSIGNKPFPEKLLSYGRDNLLNQQKEIAEFLADNTKPFWDIGAIKRRKDRIVNAAKEIWDIQKIH